MVGSYISKFNTWGAQTDDCKLESNISLDNHIEEQCHETVLRPPESPGLYQRSVGKMRSLGEEMMSSYKEPLDKAVISGAELQQLVISPFYH